MEQVATIYGPEAITPQMLQHDIPDECAWTGGGLSPEDWVIPLPEVCLAELDEAVHLLHRYPQPIHLLLPKDFQLTACAEIMSQVRAQLEVHTGIAILDRIPVERYRLDDNKAIGWLLTSMLSQVVAQTRDGTFLYNVKDCGNPLGHRGRRSVTTRPLPFHTDGSWLDPPPEVVSLLCVQPAQAGGLSRFVSLLAAHNEMRRRYPDLLGRLYHPFLWDRQAEHRPGHVPYRAHPVYQYDGQNLTARYNGDSIRRGYHLADETLDLCGEAALISLKMTLNDPQSRVEVGLEAGQILYLNNHQFAHARSAFTDDPERSPPHHLVRCWGRFVSSATVSARSTL